MKICRIYATSDGESHFEDQEIPLHAKGMTGSLSERIQTSHINFRENPSDYNHDWHTAPSRLYVVMLDGEVEVEVSDGQKRRFSGGDILLAEDTFGKGHRTRNLTNTQRRSIFISLDTPPTSQTN